MCEVGCQIDNGDTYTQKLNMYFDVLNNLIRHSHPNRPAAIPIPNEEKYPVVNDAVTIDGATLAHISVIISLLEDK